MNWVLNASAMIVLYSYTHIYKKGSCIELKLTSKYVSMGLTGSFGRISERWERSQTRSGIVP
jgi:hypothetical protein